MKKLWGELFLCLGMFGFGLGSGLVIAQGKPKEVTVINPLNSNPLETVAPVKDCCHGYEDNQILDQKLKHMVRRMAVLQKEIGCIKSSMQHPQVVEVIRCTHKANLWGKDIEGCDSGWTFCEWENGEEK